MYAVTHFQQFVIIQCSKFILCYKFHVYTQYRKGDLSFSQVSEYMVQLLYLH